MKVIPVILSGGSGTRLWPISRRLRPKQFLKLVDDETSFYKALKLVNNKKLYDDAIIISNSDHRFLVAEELLENGINAKKIILEPASLNTCPAIATASFFVEADDIILVLPSDHIIDDGKELSQAVEQSLEYTENNIITFGIKPTNAATGYGYIKKSSQLNGKSYKVDGFTEKPELKLAEEYVSSGKYLWNSGIFMFKAGYFLEQLKLLKPEIYKHMQNSAFNAEKDADFIRLDTEHFHKCEAISVDFAVMEKTTNMIVNEIECGWKDIGDWKALSETKDVDNNGNSYIGDVIGENNNNSYIHSDDGLLVATGLSNVIVFKTRDVTLVADKNHAQKIRNIAEKIRSYGRSEYDHHHTEHKPWGSFENISSESNYKLKKINIKPGCKISMQAHNKRAEHWTVIAGTALVTCGGKKFKLNANESTYIPLGEIHRVENISNIPLEIIELQTGECFTEEDIIRYEDDWGREKYN